MSLSKKNLHVFIVSDGTGLTAERVITAVLVQFKRIKPIFKRFPYIKTNEQIERILAKAENLEAIVIYSLVAKDLRSWMNAEKRKRDVHAIDLLGPLLNRVSRLLDMMPDLVPGLLPELREESIRLAEAIDFTLRHDDGQSVETLGRADLIIVGVSRTSKTPTSLYLSCNHSLKVANVPIIAGIDPPKKIFTLKRRKVGLTIASERLAFIRERRLKYAESSEYTDTRHIRNELEYSHRMFERIENLQVIDVTDRSIEEIANKIV